MVIESAGAIDFINRLGLFGRSINPSNTCNLDKPALTGPFSLKLK